MIAKALSSPCFRPFVENGRNGLTKKAGKRKTSSEEEGQRSKGFLEEVPARNYIQVLARFLVSVFSKALSILLGVIIRVPRGP